jgi:hypothetical protein
VIKVIFWVAAIGLFILLGSTVNCGRRTLFGHIGNIWSSDEAQEMKQDVKEGSKPALEKAKRAGKAAVDELKADPDAGVGAGAGAGAGKPSPAPVRPKGSR